MVLGPSSLHRCAKWTVHVSATGKLYTCLQSLQLENTTVIAGARYPDQAPILQTLKQQYPDRLHLLSLDVAKASSIQASVVADCLPDLCSKLQLTHHQHQTSC